MEKNFLDLDIVTGILIINMIKITFLFQQQVFFMMKPQFLSLLRNSISFKFNQSGMSISYVGLLFSTNLQGLIKE